MLTVEAQPTLKASQHRSLDVLLEIRLTLQRTRPSNRQRRLHTQLLDLETSQDHLEPDKWFKQIEALRLETALLYIHEPQNSTPIQV